jgi:hypothetical protein
MAAKKRMWTRVVVGGVVVALLAVVGVGAWIGALAWRRGMFRSYPEPAAVDVAGEFDAILTDGWTLEGGDEVRGELIAARDAVHALEERVLDENLERWPGLAESEPFWVELQPLSWFMLPEGGIEGWDVDTIAAAWFADERPPAVAEIDGLTLIDAGQILAHAASREAIDAYRASEWPRRLAGALAREGVCPFPPAGETSLTDRLSETMGLTTACRVVTIAEAARLERAVDLGAFDEAVAAFGNIVRVARVSASDPVFISQLLSSALVSTLRESLLRVADRLPAEALRAMLDEARALERGWPDWRRSIEGERLFWIDSIERIYVRGETLEDDFLFESPTWLERLLSSRAAERHHTELAMDAMRRWSGEPWAALEASGRWPTPDRVILEAPEACVLLHRTMSMVSASDLIRGLLRTELERRALVVTLALEAFRAERGGYPASLAELAPAYLDEVPVDTMDPDGGPLSYLASYDSDAPADERRPYLLYSVGWDGEDEGGRHERRSEIDGRWRRDLDIPLTVR